MKKHFLLLIALSLYFGFATSAQLKKANRLFNLYKYSKAIPVYQKIAENENAEKRWMAMQRLADCYRLTNNVAEAKYWYQQVVNFEQADPMNYFYYGQTLRKLGLYNEAAEAFHAFQKIYPDSLKANDYYQFCIDIIDWLDVPAQAEIKNVDVINSKYSDFCPTSFNKGIVFTSDRKDDLLDKNTYDWTNFNYLDLYFTKLENFSTFWSPMSTPELLKRNFNQTFHDGPAIFSKDEKTVYVTKTEKKGGKKDKGIRTYLLKIYSAEIVKNKKLKYYPFFLNNNEFSVAHPSLNSDQSAIIFSSDMPGGFGEADLYISYLVNGKWSKPQNLGATINSKGDEVFPYLANDSTLYFSSDGRLGFGGLDLFRSDLKNNKWLEAQNLMKPLNSSYDDFGVLFSDDLKEGLFSSNRPDGKGADDIYAFRNLKYTKPAQVKSKLVASGLVRDLSSDEVLEDATIFLFDSTSDDVIILKSDENGVFESELEYDKPYVVKAMKNNFIHDCTSFRTPADEKIKSFQLPRELVLAQLKVDQGFTIENIYYDLNDWNIRDDAQEPLQNLVQIMKEYPIVAEISSHTDSRASNNYNLELSQKRAESVVRYIVLQGVGPTRLVAKGYGETRPVNQCVDGVNCTEEQHQENRRTEFKIMEIDNTLSEQNPINPNVFRAGDKISAKLFPENFFQNCMIEKNSLKEYLKKLK